MALRLQWGCKVFASDMWCLRPTAVFGKDASGAALSHSEGKTRFRNILFLNEQLPKNTIFCNRTRQIEDWAHIFRLARHWPRLAPKPTWISHLIKESWFLGANMLAVVFSNTWDGNLCKIQCAAEGFLWRDFCRRQNSEVKGLCCITGTYSTIAQTFTHKQIWLTRWVWNGNLSSHCIVKSCAAYRCVYSVCLGCVYSESTSQWVVWMTSRS